MVSPSMERYRTWVRANAHAVTAIEGALSSLTWLLPDRFSDSQLPLEAFNSVLGLLSLYHESILATPPAGPQQEIAFWPLWLGALQQVEVLVEMGSNSLEQRGVVNKFSVLAILEALKATLRLAAMRQAGGRISNVEPTNAQHPKMLTPELKLRAVFAALARFHEQHCLQSSLVHRREADLEMDSASSAAPSCSHEGPAECGRTADAGDGGSAGISGSSTQQKKAEQSYWWRRPHASSAKVAAEERTSQQQLLEDQANLRYSDGMGLLHVGEFLHLSRPILYALALRRCGRQSWRPWLMSLALDLASSWAITMATSKSSAALPAQADTRSQQLHLACSTSSWVLQHEQRTVRWSAAEQQELARRRFRLLFYLLRSPFFDRYTKRGLDGATKMLQPLPLFGTLADKAAQLVYGLQEYYTYIN